jgi:hypothetical protein
MSRVRRRKRQVKLKGKNPRGDAAANPLIEIGTGHEHLTTAATMYREMDMPFWLEQAEAEMEALGPMSGGGRLRPT